MLGPGDGTEVFLTTDTHFFASWNKVYALADANLPEPVATFPSIEVSTGVAALGNHAYAVGNATPDFHVIDMADPEDPEIIASEPLPGAGLHRVAIADEASRNPHAYVTDWAGDDIHIVDIANPYEREYVNTFTAPETPSDLGAEGNYLYVTARDLQIYDIHDRTHPDLINTFDYTYNIHNITAVGTTLYVGQRRLYHAVMYIVDASDPHKSNHLAGRTAGVCHRLGTLPRNPGDGANANRLH